MMTTWQLMLVMLYISLITTGSYRFHLEDSTLANSSSSARFGLRNSDRKAFLTSTPMMAGPSFTLTLSSRPMIPSSFGLETSKIVDFIKFDAGNVVMVTGGRNTGQVGVIKSRETNIDSFETIHVTDATGHEFATRLGNVFTVGKGTKPWVSLPKGKGIMLTIIEEARKHHVDAGVATTT